MSHANFEKDFVNKNTKMTAKIFCPREFEFNKLRPKCSLNTAYV